MSGVNKVIILGNLGQDPEVRFLPSGGSVANFSIATSERWKDKQTGESKEKTEWHRIVMFGKLAEIAGQHLKKGSKVYIEGQLQTRKWEKDGVDHWSAEIVVQGFNGTMQMLGDNQQQGAQNGTQQSQRQNAASTNQQQDGFHQQQKQAARQQPTNQQQRQATGQQTGQKVNDQDPKIDFDDGIPF